MSHAKIAKKFGVGISTVGDIKKNEASIRSFVSSMENMTMNKKGCKVMRLANDQELDEAVLPVVNFFLGEIARICWQGHT